MPRIKNVKSRKTKPPQSEKDPDFRPKLGRFTGNHVPPSRAIAIKAQLDAGESALAISKREHMSRGTITAIKYSDRFNTEVIDQVKKGLAAGWYLTADNALKSITPDKLKTASAPQLAMVAGIATDKARLCEGLSTVNVNLDSPESELEQMIEEKRKELERIQNAEVITVNDQNNASSEDPEGSTENRMGNLGGQRVRPEKEIRGASSESSGEESEPGENGFATESDGLSDSNA